MSTHRMHPLIFAGLAIMVITSGTAIRWGGPSQRAAAILIGCCWAASTLVQIMSGYRTEPLIFGDAVYAFGLLCIAWRYQDSWLVFAVMIQVVAFFVHACFYEPSASNQATYFLSNNALSVAGLILLLLATLHHAIGRRAGINHSQTAAKVAKAQTTTMSGPLG